MEHWKKKEKDFVWKRVGGRRRWAGDKEGSEQGEVVIGVEENVVKEEKNRG